MKPKSQTLIGAETFASLRRRLRGWFFAKFDNFEAHQILPILNPCVEQRGIGGFHELKTAVAFFCEPAIDVGQALWKHAAFLVKAFVNLWFAAREEMFNDHVLWHKVLSEKS